MKRVVLIYLMLICAPAFAGLTYKAQSETTGLRNATIKGTVSVDGTNLRMDVAQGDNVVFKDNAVVLSSDGGKTMSVLDPSTKTYYDLQLQDLVGSATSMLSKMGDMVKVTFDNPHVVVRDAGDGGKVEGYSTRKYVLDASYDMNIDALGQKITSHMSMNTEAWTTGELSAEFSSFLQLRGMRTGIEPVDKLIEAQSTTMKGFPLKQVSTIKVSQGGGSDMTMTTTSSVTDIARKNIEASTFAMPAGYTRTDDPVTRMMKQIKMP
jgi:uncharacterized protein DUF4412